MEYSAESNGTLEVIFIVVLIFVLLMFMVIRFRSFNDDRRYIKGEMDRSGDDEEFMYWKNELSDFYLLSIPIFGHLIYNLRKKESDRK